MQKVKPFMEKLLHESTPRIPKRTDNLWEPNRVQALDTFNPSRWNVAISTRWGNSVMTSMRQPQTSSRAKKLTAKVLQMTHSSTITDPKVSKKWTNFIIRRLICLASTIQPLDRQLPWSNIVVSRTALVSIRTPLLVKPIQILHRSSRRLSVLLLIESRYPETTTMTPIHISWDLKARSKSTITPNRRDSNSSRISKKSMLKPTTDLKKNAKKPRTFASLKGNNSDGKRENRMLSPNIMRN